MLKKLPYGPNVYWTAQHARIGTVIIIATRLIGRWYWLRVR